jgi:hypothetical protein
MFKPVSIVLFVSLIAGMLLLGCGNDHSERNIRKKIVADSIRRADSLEKNKAAIGNMKSSLEDSVLAEKEFEDKVSTYDSLRLADSLKLKWNKRRWKDRDAVKPAPKRDLWAKSPIK